MPESAVHPWAAEAADARPLRHRDRALRAVAGAARLRPGGRRPRLRLALAARPPDGRRQRHLDPPRRPRPTATRRVRLGPLVACVALRQPGRPGAGDRRRRRHLRRAGACSASAAATCRRSSASWGSPGRRRASGRPRWRRRCGSSTPSCAGRRSRSPAIGSGWTGRSSIPPPVQQPYVPILVAGGGEQTTLRFAARYADAANLGAVSWAGGAFTPDDVRRKLAVLDGHLAEAGPTGRSGAALGPARRLPGRGRGRGPGEVRGAAAGDWRPSSSSCRWSGPPEDALPRVRAMLEAGMRYVIFIVMPGDEETLRLLAERVLPAVA